MAIDEISSTNPVLAAVLQGRDRTSSPLTTTKLYSVLNPVPATGAATQNFTLTQQAALLVNDTLQTLNFEPSSPVDALLINETNPNLAAVLETQPLSIAQQVALAFNDTLQTMTTPLAAATSTNAAAVEGGIAQNLTPGPLDTTLLNVTTAGLATVVETPGVNLTATAVTPTQITSTATETAVASEVLNPSQPAAVQPILDRNPIAVSVYEIRDQKPAPRDQKPTRKDVWPLMPIGRLRPVDRLVLRQEWERRKESGQLEEMAPRQPVAEKSIREMVSRVNEDLAANGLPLHLVLAKNDEGYCLDVYDCSDDTVCRLAQEVQLDLNELLTILDNLQHETGIIININT